MFSCRNGADMMKEITKAIAAFAIMATSITPVYAQEAAPRERHEGPRGDFRGLPDGRITSEILAAAQDAMHHRRDRDDRDDHRRGRDRDWRDRDGDRDNWRRGRDRGDWRRDYDGDRFDYRYNYRDRRHYRGYGRACDIVGYRFDRRCRSISDGPLIIIELLGNLYCYRQFGYGPRIVACPYNWYDY